MTFLLDVNVIVALLDQDHVFNAKAHHWFEEQGRADWATCPITENGVLRILGHARYPNGPGSPAAVCDMMKTLCSSPGHSFWADKLSLLDFSGIDLDRLGASARITDVYLLALAVQNGGRLATLDRRLATDAVEGGAEALHLIE